MYMKTRKCGWCSKNPTTTETNNMCTDCHVESLRKIGWNNHDLAVVAWAGEKGMGNSFYAFDSLEKEEQAKILKEYATS